MNLDYDIKLGVFVPTERYGDVLIEAILDSTNINLFTGFGEIVAKDVNGYDILALNGFDGYKRFAAQRRTPSVPHLVGGKMKRPRND